MPADVDGLRDYATARGYPAPALASESDAEAALARASDYILVEFVPWFADGFDETAPNVDLAIYEAALSELNADGTLKTGSFWGSVVLPADRKMLTSVGPISWTPVAGSINFAPFSSRIEALLKGYRRSANVRWVVRA